MKYLILTVLLIPMATFAEIKILPSIFSSFQNSPIHSACQLPQEEDICIPCQASGNLSFGFEEITRVSDFICTFSPPEPTQIQPITIEPIPTFPTCIKTDSQLDFTEETMFETCRCIANEIIPKREAGTYIELSEATVKHATGITQLRIFQNAITSIQEQNAEFDPIRAQANITTSCDPFAELRNAANSDECGKSVSTFLRKIIPTQALSPTEATGQARLFSKENFIAQFGIRSSLPRMTNSITETDSALMYETLRRHAYYAYKAGSLSNEKLQRLPIIFDEFDKLNEGLANNSNRTANHENQLTTIQSAINQFGGELFTIATEIATSFCSVSSKRLMEACKLTNEEKSIFNSEMFAFDIEDTYFKKGQDLQTSIDHANLFSQGDYLTIQTLATCESYKGGLVHSYNRCAKQGPINNNSEDSAWIAACEKYNYYKQFLCNKIISQYETDATFRSSINEISGLENDGNIKAILMDSSDNCITTGNAAADHIYNLFVSLISPDFEYLPGTEVPPSPIDKNDDLQTSRPSFLPLPIKAPSSNYSHDLPINANPIPLRPPETQTSEKVIDEFIPAAILPTNYTQLPLGPYLPEENIEIEDQKDKIISSPSSQSDEYKKLMAKIEALNSKLEDKDKNIDSVSKKLENTTLSDYNRQRLEIERERLRLDREKLNLERERLLFEREQIVQTQETEISKTKKQASPKATPTVKGNPGKESTISKSTNDSSKNNAVSSGTIIPNGGSVSQDASVSSSNGLTLSGVYINSAEEITNFFAGEKTFRQHKLILDDPENPQNVIVCFLSPEILETAVKEKRQEFNRKDYLCGDPVNKEEVEGTELIAPIVEPIKKPVKPVIEKKRESNIFYDTVRELTK